MTSISRAIFNNAPQCLFSSQYSKLHPYCFEEIKQNSPFIGIIKKKFKQKTFEFETMSYHLLLREKEPWGFLVCEKKVKYEGEISVLDLRRFCLNFSVDQGMRDSGPHLINRAKEIAKDLNANVIRFGKTQNIEEIAKQVFLESGFKVDRKGEREDLLIYTLPSRKSGRKWKTPPTSTEEGREKRRRLAPKNSPFYSTTARRAFHQAKNCFNKGEKTRAVEHIKQSLRKYKEIIQMLHVRNANAYTDKAQVSGNRRFLSKASEELSLRGKITFTSSEEERVKWMALSPCTARHGSRGANFYFDRAIEAEGRGNNKIALENYKNIYRLEKNVHKGEAHPHLAEALIDRGCAKYQNGKNGNPDIDKALEHYKILLESAHREYRKACTLSRQIQGQRT